MRNFYRCIVLLACLATACVSGPTVRAQTPQAGVQTLFEGDHLCGDNPTDCGFPAVTAFHRYLHIVLHDKPGDTDWGVWVGPDCGSAMSEANGAVPVKASGYVEVVVDLQFGHSTSWEGTPLCFLFRGGYGLASTYYASYFDDSVQVDATAVYPEYQQLGGRPDLADLDVTYIQRSPAYAYDASPNMPQPGQPVTYTAHVVNQSGRPLSSFGYHWLLDGKEIGSGQSSSGLGAFDQMLVSVTLPWSMANHKLTFRAVASEQELSIQNDSLSVDTNAITLGFWVEQSAYTYFRDYQQRYCAVQGCAGSDSLEDWLQRQVHAWNVLFHRAVYPGLTPAGITTRVRVDKIVVVPDGALPLHGGIATDDPDKRDHSVDLQWGLPARDIAEAYSQSSPGSFRIDWALLHELGHARSLADLYRFDFPVDSPSRIDVVGADGLPVYNASDPFGVENKIRGFAGSDGGTLVYQNMERDLMSCVCSDFYSPYSALVLNRLGNRRALCGNFNPPCNIGDWYTDIPPNNVIRVLNQSGRTPAGPVTVRLFYDSGGGYDIHQFTQQDSTAVNGTGNEFTLPADPFGAGASTDRIGHYLLLIEVTTPQIDQFCFQEPTDFNVAYWEGHTDTSHPAVFTLRLGHTVQNACMLSLPEPLVNEPFGTSTSTSSVRLGAVTRGPKGKYRVATVQLFDAARIPMHTRQLIVRDQKGRIVAQARTDAHGGARTRVPASATSVSVDDVTDNHLILASG